MRKPLRANKLEPAATSRHWLTFAVAMAFAVLSVAVPDVTSACGGGGKFTAGKSSGFGSLAAKNAASRFAAMSSSGVKNYAGLSAKAFGPKIDGAKFGGSPISTGKAGGKLPGAKLSGSSGVSPKGLGASK